VSASPSPRKAAFPFGMLSWACDWMADWPASLPRAPRSGSGRRRLDSLSGNDYGEEHRDPKHMGSPSVSLDSWCIRPSRGSQHCGLSIPKSWREAWTRIECARLTEEASDYIATGQTLNDEQVARLQTHWHRIRLRNQSVGEPEFPANLEIRFMPERSRLAGRP